MADYRIRDLSTFWHDQFKALRKETYKWNKGKEQKHLQWALKWADAEWGEKAVENLKTAAKVYLSSEDKFLKQRNWDLCDFLAKPSVWFKVAEEPVRPQPRPVAEVVPERRWPEHRMTKHDLMVKLVEMQEKQANSLRLLYKGAMISEGRHPFLRMLKEALTEMMPEGERATYEKELSKSSVFGDGSASLEA